MLISETWHWERVKNVSDYPRIEYLATCTCGWDCHWKRQQLDTARSDWEDHIMEEHRKENTP